MAGVKIALIGDVMCGDSFYALGRGVGSALDRHGAGFLPSDLVAFFQRHDLVLFNIESPLSDIDRRGYSLRRLHMRGRPAAASYLAQWGLSCANVANNHILEQGRACALDTVRHLRDAGIRTVGGGREGLFEPGLQVAEVEVKGHSLSILGLCLLDEKYAYAGGQDLNEVLSTVQSLSRAGRTVLVSVHWGKEFMDRPTAQQRRTAYALVDAGAAVVAGHHPHVMQGIEHRRTGLICYSLGNFVFDSFLADCCWSVAVTLELLGSKVVTSDWLPVVKDRHHRPVFAQGTEKARLAAEVRRRCELLEGAPDFSEEQQRHYEQEFARADTAWRKELRMTLLKTFFRTRLVFWPQFLLRPIQRRLGRW